MRVLRCFEFGAPKDHPDLGESILTGNSGSDFKKWECFDSSTATLMYRSSIQFIITIKPIRVLNHWYSVKAKGSYKGDDLKMK